ncbi:MAG: EAL domain-containing protein [Solirubrobacterales bacterium]|nr:EAL domain-containing protein [Solirubrobacterales bacterium]
MSTDRRQTKGKALPGQEALLGDLRRSRSVREAAEVTARASVEQFGAIGAVVSDPDGPIAARPTRLDPLTIAELTSVPAGVGVGKPGSALAGMTIACFSHPEMEGMRLSAAWAPESSARIDDLESAVNALAVWLRQYSDPTLEIGNRSFTGPGPTSADYELEKEEMDSAGFEHLIDSVPAILYTAEMGESGRWLYVSPQIEKILGYTPEEWTSDTTLWYRSIHPDDREHALAFEDERLIGLDIHPPAEYRLRARDGRYVWIYERARLIRNEEGVPQWHGVMQDISALKAAETAIELKAEQQVLVARLGEMAIRGEDPDSLLRYAVDWIGQIEGVLEASIWEQEDYRELHLCHRSANLGWSSTLPYDPEQYPDSHLTQGDVVLIPSWEDDPRLERFVPFLPEPVRSSMIAPIMGAVDQFGMIIVHSGKISAFSEQDGNFLRAAANVLGNSIERSRTDLSLEHRLNHDPLTDLPNRQLFTRRLAEAIDEAGSREGTVGLLFLDIDHFKLINAGIGHHAGDELLREIAPRLSKSVRRGDTVARFGGDEFGIVLASIKSADEAKEVAGRMLQSISEPIPVAGTERFVTASIGVATYQPGREEPKSAEDLIRDADAAMYLAKESGRARVESFGKPIRERVLRRLDVERQLHGAIENGELEAVYQPIVSLRSGKLRAFEALTRWNHPEQGMLEPDLFIPIAEESDLIGRIDSWIMAEAVRQAGLWNVGRDESDRITVSVNASSRQIRKPGLAAEIAELLVVNDLRPENLAIEITENILLTGSAVIDDVLREIHDLGVRLALDDFGTGYSSLSYLSDFPLDAIKIDRAFVEGLGRGDPGNSAIADAITQIGRALSLLVVAEAVSTETQLQMVRDLGCSMAQGYLIAPPLGVDQATDFVRGSGLPDLIR